VRDLPRLGLGRDRVVPLTFHVDYWDDLGWKDPFATPELTRRQREYVTSGRLASPDGSDSLGGVYTPQMIVSGAVHFSGARRETALAEIARAAAQPEVATLSARATLGGAEAHVTASLAGTVRAETQKSWRLSVVIALKEALTPVRHGENSGETLAEAAIVRWLSTPQPISTASGAIELDVPRPHGVAWKDLELVAFVQSAATKQVISVRAIDLTAAPAPPTASGTAPPTAHAASTKP
jgi:hypothetical protein